MKLKTRRLLAIYIVWVSIWLILFGVNDGDDVTVFLFFIFAPFICYWVKRLWSKEDEIIDKDNKNNKDKFKPFM